MPDDPTTLAEMIRKLKAPPPTLAPVGRETWQNMIQRISRPGLVHPIEERTFDYFLEVLPPRWLGSGHFAFSEGGDLLRLFWSAASGRFFCRQLTREEHRLFVRLAGIGFSSG
jgi:hypothetical protein